MQLFTLQFIWDPIVLECFISTRILYRIFQFHNIIICLTLLIADYRATAFYFTIWAPQRAMLWLDFTLVPKYINLSLIISS